LSLYISSRPLYPPFNPFHLNFPTAIPFLGIKPNFYYLVALSPYTGVYFSKSGDRVDDVKVILASKDDDKQNEITVEGNDEEIERMWRTLEWNEKGMVKIEGLLEGT